VRDALLHSAAAERNRQPILEVLQRWLPARGAALEIASGTGQHAAHFAAALPGWTWLPTDPDPACRASIAARRDALALANLLPPLPLDVQSRPWPIVAPVDAIFCANLLHISPWASCAGLMRGAVQLLAADGRLIVYGPFLIDGVATAASNLAFDADLRARDPAWGLRRLADVAAEAGSAGLELRERVAMPAHNAMLLFCRAAR
jgi:Protein of unknown function (DUF938)